MAYKRNPMRCERIASLARLAADPTFGVPVADLEAALDPHRFVGRAPEQVDDFLEQVVGPVLAGHARADDVREEVRV
jgi:adenylosuccinate lyase